jgi:hypothetical protein
MEPIIVEFEVMATPEHAGDTYSGPPPQSRGGSPTTTGVQARSTCPTGHRHGS